METIKTKIELLRSYSQSMGGQYNHDGSKRSIELGADYQMKCEKLIEELSTATIPDGLISVYNSAKSDFNYFKKK